LDKFLLQLSPFTCKHERELNELKIKLASIEEEAQMKAKEEQDRTRDFKRQALANIIRRRLRQYREESDYQKEIEFRLGQINEYNPYWMVVEMNEGNF
jgi:hypothetical protein